MYLLCVAVVWIAAGISAQQMSKAKNVTFEEDCVAELGVNCGRCSRVRISGVPDVDRNMVVVESYCLSCKLSTHIMDPISFELLNSTELTKNQIPNIDFDRKCVSYSGGVIAVIMIAISIALFGLVFGSYWFFYHGQIKKIPAKPVEDVMPSHMPRRADESVMPLNDAEVSNSKDKPKKFEVQKKVESKPQENDSPVPISKRGLGIKRNKGGK